MTKVQPGLLLSSVFHAALLAGLALNLPQRPAPDAPMMPIPVEIVDISDIARVTQDAMPSMEAAPQEQEDTPLLADEPDEADAPEEPAPAEPPAPEPQPEPVKTAAAPPPPSETAPLIDKSKPKAAVKRLDISELAKTLEKDVARNAQRDTRATITLQQLMDAKVSRCFSLPSGGVDVGRMTVQVRFRLDERGVLVDGPEQVGATGITANNAAFGRALGDAAVRAVRRCAPYELPADLMDVWANQDFEMNFDPSRLL